MTPWTAAHQASLFMEFSRKEKVGVGCHFLFQGILLIQGSNPGLLYCRQILYCLSRQGSPAWPIRRIKTWPLQRSLRLGFSSDILSPCWTKHLATLIRLCCLLQMWLWYALPFPRAPPLLLWPTATQSSGFCWDTHPVCSLSGPHTYKLDWPGNACAWPGNVDKTPSLPL